MDSPDRRAPLTLDVKKLIERASAPGTPGACFVLQLAPRAVLVTNRAFRREAQVGDGETRMPVISAFASDPATVPGHMWKEIELTPGARALIDDYTARLLVGLGVRRYMPAGLDCSRSVPGLVAEFVDRDGEALSDAETTAAASRMSEVAAAVYEELAGSKCTTRIKILD